MEAVRPYASAPALEKVPIVDISTIVNVPSNLPPTLSVEEAGELLGVSRSTAYAYVHDGSIKTIRLGNSRLLVPTAWLLRLLEIEPERTDDTTPQR